MPGRLDVRRWIRVNKPLHAVALSEKDQFVAVGTEQGITLYNLDGRPLLDYPTSAYALPIHCLSLAPGLEFMQVGAREGRVLRLELKHEGMAFGVQTKQLYEVPNDLHTLATTPTGDLIALGHLSSALTVIQGQDGSVRWRRHPDEGTGTEGQLWSVAFSGEGKTLYVGSAGATTNLLAAIEPQGGAVRSHQLVTSRVVRLAPLPQAAGVVVILADSPYDMRIVAYDATLSKVFWEQAFYEPLTALATDPQRMLLALGVGHEGRVILFDSQTGRVLGEENLRAMVLALAMAQGRTIAAATQNEDVALLTYYPEEIRL